MPEFDDIDDDIDHLKCLALIHKAFKFTIYLLMNGKKTVKSTYLHILMFMVRRCPDHIAYYYVF